MSWLEEQFTEADAAQNKIKGVERKIANRWHDEFPNDDEGSEGETRYIYSNGVPAMAVKMNGGWHFQTLQTMGKGGAYRSDNGGLSADMLQSFMPNDPAYDSQWRQLVPIPEGDLIGYSPGDVVTDPGTIANQGAAMLSTGPRWECVYPGFFLCTHNLGLSRPPKMMSAYICDSAPSEATSVDTAGHKNCLVDPYPDLQDAINDGCRSIVNQLVAGTSFTSSTDAGTWLYSDELGNHTGGIVDHGVVFYNGEFLTSWPIYGFTLAEGLQNRSILCTVMSSSSTTPTLGGLNMGPGVSNAGEVVATIIGPNHILFYPRWAISPGSQYANDVDNYMGFMNQEWLRLYIWR
jgi:hypothetical protein